MSEHAPQLIRTLLEKLAVTYDAVEEVLVAGQQIYNVKTDDSKRLIGPHGDNLRSLNYLVRRLAERIEGLKDERFLVDVNGYQLHRIRDLEQKASLLAERVRTFKSSAEMSPMNAYERMIVHSMFAEDPEVVTESDGEGKMRHVVLRYRD